MGAFVRVLHAVSNESEGALLVLANALHEIVVDCLEDEDVIVITEKPLSSVNLSCVEVFIQVNAFKHVDAGTLTEHVAERVESWRAESQFDEKVNINVVPIDWYSKLGE